MRAKRRIARALPALACALAVATAGPAFADGDTLTLAQAMEKAKASSRQLDSLRTRLEIARSRLDGVTWVQNPELRVRDISSEYITDRFDDIEVGLRWRLRDLGETEVERQRRRVRVSAVEVEAARAEQRLVARVRRAYARLVFSEALFELRSERLKTETARLGLVDELVKLGRRSVVYQAKARLWLGEARSDLMRIKQGRNEARRALARLIGVDEAVSVSSEPLAFVKLSEEELAAIAAARRPEARHMRTRIDLAQARYERERLRNVPWPTFVEARYHHDTNNQDRVELLFGLGLPIFDWNREDTKAFALAVDRKEARSAALGEQLDEELSEAHAVYREALLDWELTSAESRALIDQTEGIAERAKGHGTLPPDEILELRLLVLETKELLLRKRYALDRALAELLYAVGAESRADLSSAASPADG